MRAALHGDLVALRQELTKPGDINARNGSGATALFLAASRDDNLAAVQILLEAGADPNKADLTGTTPLIAGVRPGQLDIVRALVDGGAVIDVRNQDGDSPLTNAATWGSEDIVRFLLEKNADRSLVDGVGLTAAELARQQGHVGIAELISNFAQQS